MVKWLKALNDTNINIFQMENWKKELLPGQRGLVTKLCSDGEKATV